MPFRVSASGTSNSVRDLVACAFERVGLLAPVEQGSGRDARGVGQEVVDRHLFPRLRGIGEVRADGIRVNAIAPGAIPGGGFVADNLGALVAQIPIGRPGTPDDIAQVAVAVLSERFGRYVVGTTVEVDGGIGLISWIPAKA